MAGTENGACTLFRQQLQAAHQLLEATIADVTDEQAHWSPPGTAVPVGAAYAHVVISEDGVVNGTLRRAVPLFAADFQGRTGLSELPPAPDPGSPGFPDWGAWSRRVKVELPAFREYAQAVYAASDAFLATITDDQLGHLVDLSTLGLGKVSLAFVLNNGLLGNAFTHCGEIACLKGMQGTRGYPF